MLPALERFNSYAHQDLSPSRHAVWMAALDEPLPLEGVGLDAVLAVLCQTVIPDGVALGAPGFSAWVTGAPTTSGTVAKLAATVAGPQRYLIQPFHYLETIALRWLSELFGLPDDMQGVFTSGGSVANLIGLGAARQRAYEKLGHDPARDGYRATPVGSIYAATTVHHVVARAAGVLGLGRRSVVLVETDGQERLDLGALRDALIQGRAAGRAPVAIVASAGTVDAGAVDPIAEMADLADEFGSWLHVDGAYGLFGMLDPRVAPLYAGLERADSVVADPHKWLSAPIGCGSVFVRDRALLARAFTTEPAEYLEGTFSPGRDTTTYDSMGEPYHYFGIEHSAPSRGVTVWAILKEIGANGLRRRIMRDNDFARHIARRAGEDQRLELLAPPILSICCFRYRASGLDDRDLDELNAEIARRLRAEGRYVPSTTRIRGSLAIRPCYINPRTTIAEVNGLADRVRELGDQLTSAGQPFGK
jgi:aromatic-L-amino-acid decarboxylase